MRHVARQERLLSQLDPEAASETLRLWALGTPSVIHYSRPARRCPQEAAAAPTCPRKSRLVTCALAALACLLWAYCALRQRFWRWWWAEVDLPAWLVVLLVLAMMAVAGGMERTR